MFNRKKNNKGFTLVELLVVIAIIGILAVVAIPSLFKQVNKAKASDAVAYISAARTAAIAEYASNSSEVPTASAVEALVEDRPDCVVDIDSKQPGNQFIEMVGTTSDTKIQMKVKLSKIDIATQVATQLGDIATNEESGTATDVVTIDVYTTDQTK